MNDIDSLLNEIEQVSSRVSSFVRSRKLVASSNFKSGLKSSQEFGAEVGAFALYLAHGLDILDLSDDPAMRLEASRNYFNQVGDYVVSQWGSVDNAFRAYQTSGDKFFDDLSLVCARWQNNVLSSGIVTKVLGEYSELSFDDKLAYSDDFYRRTNMFSGESPLVRLPKFEGALLSYARQISNQ